MAQLHRVARSIISVALLLWGMGPAVAQELAGEWGGTAAFGSKDSITFRMGVVYLDKGSYTCALRWQYHAPEGWTIKEKTSGQFVFSMRMGPGDTLLNANMSGGAIAFVQGQLFKRGAQDKALLTGTVKAWRKKSKKPEWTEGTIVLRKLGNDVCPYIADL
jgi:hypothetical protein